MPVVDVRNLKGETVGQVQLADEVFAAKVNEHLLHEAVRHYLAGQRAGTHKTKDKSEVSGSGKKLWKQKGTGRARIGSIRSPLWRHGGTVHGPTPRKYSYALPKKMIAGALRSALSAKVAQQKLTIVDEWALESHKTKAFRESLDKLDGETRTILLVESAPDVNLEGLTMVPSTQLEPYDLLRHDRLMLTRETAERLSRALSTNKSEAEVSTDSAAVAAAPAKKAPIEADTEKQASAKAKPAAAKKAKKAAPAKAEKKAKAAAKPKAKKE